MTYILSPIFNKLSEVKFR